MTVIDLGTLTLAHGAHPNGPPPGDPGCQMCFMEAYNALITPPDQPIDALDLYARMIRPGVS
jgi:hypothetical protein